jgi:hypothetical protein
VVVESPGKNQAVEIKAACVRLLGAAPPEGYALAKGRLPLDFLRSLPHLRPRSNTHLAVLRVRSRLAYAIHTFFQVSAPRHARPDHGAGSRRTRACRSGASSTSTRPSSPPRIARALASSSRRDPQSRPRPAAHAPRAPSRALSAEAGPTGHDAARQGGAARAHARGRARLRGRLLPAQSLPHRLGPAPGAHKEPPPCPERVAPRRVARRALSRRPGEGGGAGVRAGGRLHLWPDVPRRGLPHHQVSPSAVAQHGKM